MLQAVKLTCESRVNPIGLDEKKPRFGWQILCDEISSFRWRSSAAMSETALLPGVSALVLGLVNETSQKAE